MVSAFAAGFVGRLGDIEDEKRQAKREDERIEKEWERRRQERMENLMERRREVAIRLAASSNSYLGASSSSSSGNEKGSELAAYGQFLVKQGVDKDRVARLMATNDVDGLGELVGQIKDAQSSYRKIGEDFTPELLNDLVENTISIDGDTYTIDTGNFFESLGINKEDYDFSPEELAVMGEGKSVTRPGKILTGADIEPRERYSPQEIEKLQEVVAQEALNTATKEFQGYNKMIVDLNEGGALYNALGGDSDVISDFRSFALDRAVQIEKALEQQKSGSFIDLMDMYGQTSFQKLDDYYRLSEAGVPMPYLGDGSKVLAIPVEQKDWYEPIFKRYGLTGYRIVE